MTEEEIDIRDLNGLWESLARDLQDLARQDLTPGEREQFWAHARWAIEEGQAIFRRLNPTPPELENSN
jgi:NAD-dependent SIR2 family protein deacetylase